MADVGDRGRCRDRPASERTDRGVSPVFSYALTLGITTLLVAGLLMAAGGYVDSQRQLTTENELSVIGNQLSADMAAADRLHRTDGAEEVAITRDIPRRVVGTGYRVHLRDDGEGPTDYYLELVAASQDISVTVGIALAPGTTVDGGTVDGGRVVVTVENGDLVIHNA